MKLPRLTLNETRARAVLARQGAELPLELGARWLASLSPLPLSEAAAAWSAAWTLSVEWGGARFVLRLPGPALTAWAEGSLATPLELGELAPELRALALDGLWQQMAAALLPLRRGSARLLAVHEGDPMPADAAATHRIAIDLRRADGQAACAAEIGTDALGLLLLAGVLAQRAPPAAEPSPSLPLCCRLEIGRSRLAQADLRTLRRGDVVLFHEAWLDRADDGTARVLLVTHGQAGWRVALTGERLTLIEPWSPRVTLAADSPNPGDAPLSLDAVPVTLSFDLGELTLPLAELRQLVAGQSFDLGRPLAGAVQVRANGALLGLGELVEIDGRLGVALTQLGPP